MRLSSVVAMDLDTLCRICLSRKRSLINLYGENNNLYQKEGVTLKSIWPTYFGSSVEKDDNYPQNICEKCCSCLLNFHDLKKLHEESVKVLVNLENCKSNENQIEFEEVLQMESNKDEDLNDDSNHAEQTPEDPLPICDNLDFVDQSNIIEEIVDTNVSLYSDHFEDDLNIINNTGLKEEVLTHQHNSNPPGDMNKSEAPSNQDDSLNDHLLKETSSIHDDNVETNRSEHLTDFRLPSYGKGTNDICKQKIQIANDDLLAEDEQFENHEPFILNEEKSTIRNDNNDTNSLNGIYANYFAALVNIDPPYICKWCDETFPDNRKFYRHINTHIQNKCQLCANGLADGEPCGHGHCTKCPKCDLSFKKANDLYRHENMIHRILDCTQCDEKVERGSMVTHLDEEHEMCKHVHLKTTCQLCDNKNKIRQEKSFRCLTCNRAFTTNYYLRHHMLKHENQKNYVCNVCNMSFLMKQYLNMHMEIHQPGEYFCPICGKMFRMKRTLKSHIYRHKGNPKHKCHICSRCFDNNNRLRTHLLTHTREKPFRCSICDNAFISKSTMKKHIKKIHGLQVTRKYKRKV